MSGYVGNFRAVVRKKARYVNEEVCTGCGLCEEKCPAKRIPSEFELGLGMRKAIYRPFLQAVPSTPVLDKENCIYFQRGKCRLCERVCPAKAIDYEQQDQLLELDVGAVVVATGFDQMDPSPMLEYGYGVYPEVYTGLEIERLSNATGPTSGEIVMRNGEKPKRVAIIHCVGSRDEHYHPYCSRICCMYSLKLAHLIEEKSHAEVFQFYMDMRSFGKDYEEFYERVQREGVIMVRGRGAQVMSDGDRLAVRAEDTDLGRPVHLPVDMVVLATAVEPSKGAAELAKTLHATRDRNGFFLEAHPKLRPVETATAGVFLAGCAQGPRDVPDTVAHAGAAAQEVVRLFNKGEVIISPTVAQVDQTKCVGCGDCIPTCPYTAIDRNADGKAEINPALCQGCGTCVATCPSGAIAALHFTDQEIVAQIDGLLQALA